MLSEHQLIVFDLGEYKSGDLLEDRGINSEEFEREEFGIDIMEVKEIIRPKEIRPLPQTSDFIEGIINLRGEIIVIIDLRKKFGFKEVFNSDTRIIIAEVDSKKVGFIVNSASEVMRLTADEVFPPPQRVAGFHCDSLEGIGKKDGRLIILLNFNKILAEEEFDELAEV